MSGALFDPLKFCYYNEIHACNAHRRLVEVPANAIDGAVIRFIGLEVTITDVFARFKWLDGSVARGRSPGITRCSVSIIPCRPSN